MSERRIRTQNFLVIFQYSAAARCTLFTSQRHHNIANDPNMKQQTILIFAALTATSYSFSICTSRMPRGGNAALYYAKGRDTIRPETLDLGQEQIYPKKNTKVSKTNKKQTKHDVAWYKAYEELREFHSTHAHSDVPYSFPNKRLVRWVTNQRQNFKKASMTQERIDSLDSLDFTWEARLAWESRFEELASFYNSHGHLKIRLESDASHLDLVRFVSAQRHQYRLRDSGKNSTMTEERLEALKSIGFQFEPTGRNSWPNFEWKDRFQELKQFRAHNGHVDVSENDDPDLHSWVHKQIENHLAGRLDDGKYKILKDLGVKAERQYCKSRKAQSASDTKWDKQFKELKDYATSQGDCKVPQHYKQNPKLGLFVKNQRRQHKLMKLGEKSSMTEERLEKLQSIGFVWNKYYVEKAPDDIDIIEIPVRLALKRSLDRRKSRMSQIGLEENAELLLEKYKRMSQWGMSM